MLITVYTVLLLAAVCTLQGVDTTSTTVISTVKGEWLQYTRTFTAGGPYDIYLTGAYRARGTKNGAYASLGLQFFKPYSTTPLPGAEGTLLLPPVLLLLLLMLLLLSRECVFCYGDIVSAERLHCLYHYVYCRSASTWRKECAAL
eukprot:17657-Heterococcus_DN1.PRE.4